MIGMLALLALATFIPAEGGRDRPQSRDTRPAPAAGTATIRGVVVSQESRPRPLRRARVALSGPALTPGRVAITRDDGTFAFEGLAAGRYTITAAKDAYVPMSYGATRPGRPGKGVQVRPGESPAVTLALPRGAVITGTITDVDGSPAQGVTVTALAPRLVGPFGERRLTAAGLSSSPTDDRGVYRLFGLPAGEYVVSVQSQMRAVGLQVGEVRMMSGGAPGTRTLAQAPVYYPNTTDLARASKVAVAAGEERPGIDIQIQYVPMATVSGSLPPGSHTAVTLARAGQIAGAESSRMSHTDHDGRFSFSGVPPGQYQLIAQSIVESPVTAGGSPLTVPPDTVTWATADVIVDGDDVTGVVLSPQASLTISGRLAFEGTRPPPPDLAGLRVPSIPASQTIGNFQLTLPRIQLAPGGRFVVTGIFPGVYRLGALERQPVPGLRAPVGGWWLKSIVVNGRDILDGPLEIREGTDAAVATFADDASELSGTVSDGRGAPLADGPIVVFAADRSSWFFNSRRIAALRTDPAGRYSVRNLPPGDYRVAAAGDLEPGEWYDPAALERLLPEAAAGTISGVGKTIVNLTVR